jgi:putative ABC transport system permease protein
MIRNYLTIAFRNIIKHSFYALINIFGMTIGIAACLMIFLYVADELSYDRFHRDADRIFQVGLHGKVGDQDIKTSTTCPPLALALIDEVPEVEAVTRIIPFYNDPAVRYKEKAFTEKEVIFADSNFFEFFTFKLLEGDPATCLKEPRSVVLSEQLVTKYFGKEPALGKVVIIDDSTTAYKVTGIVENAPVNSHLGYSMILSAASSERLKENVWLNNWMHNYFKLREGALVAAVEEKMKDMVVKYVGPELAKYMGVTIDQIGKKGGEYGYFATPITDIHLRAVTADGIRPNGSIMHVYFFTGIGIFILVIACINFMNLATARSAGRAKEVGLRKTLGSLRTQLIGQFLTESFLFSSVAVLLALMVCFTALPAFNLLSGKELTMVIFLEPWFIAGIIGLIMVVGFFSGSYPAFYLTSFNPTDVLKGKVRAGVKSKGIRSGLVVFQFFLSMLLIIFTAVVFEQVRYMNNANLGFDKQNVMVISNAWRLEKNKDAFRNAITQRSDVVKVSYANNAFPGVNNTTIFRSVSSEQDHIMGMYYADYDHIDVMKIKMTSGRYFSRDIATDSSAVVLNEAAAGEFGFVNPIGEELIYNDRRPKERLKIIGTFQNFNFESFKNEVRPLAIRLTPNSNVLLVKYQGNASELVSSLQSLWKGYAPDQPFDYSFLDERFDELFRSEQRMGDLFTLFSAFAILIASLGLFALASFTTEQRTKEIGIRKAMGASVPVLMILLSKEFTRLVLIAFLPAAAVGWYCSESWLSGFAHRIEIDPWIFVISGLGSIVIAWLTVAYQSIKAAGLNPVKSLRYE